MANYQALFTPLTIKHLTVRNRILSTSHATGYSAGGNITERYRLYQAEKAKGGVGLTQFGGATAVSAENSFHYGQINGAVDEVIPQYQAMANSIHEHGAACMIQLTHGGRRERWDGANWLPAFSASCRRELIHRSFPVEMEHHDIQRIKRDFAQAVRRAREGGLDGVEISCQAGTLIEQFWSPAINYRDDQYGGSLANRMRFGLEVLEEIRRVVGEDYIVGIRMPGDEMLDGGLTQEDCLAIAQIHSQSGMVDFISVVGAQATDYKSSATIWPTMWLPEAPFLYLASGIKARTNIPIFHATRITDADTAVRAVEQGHVDMVGMTRALIADPHFVNKVKHQMERDIRPCVGAGYCVDRIISGQDALCIYNAAAGREQTMPHVIAQSPQKQRTVVVGAGPAGLEAARVLASRGHQVVLFEKADRIGGQINIAAKGWREPLRGIREWFDHQLQTLAVDVRLNTEATARHVYDEQPDIVVIATGGSANKGWFDGEEFAQSTWEILDGAVAPGEQVLLYDENGSHPGPSCAEFLARGGASVEVVTPDRALCTELAETNIGAYMNELYKHGVTIRPDTKLIAVSPKGNHLVVTLANMYSGETEDRVVDQIVGDHGTLPVDELYFELKPQSRNLGEVDLDALTAGRAQRLITNPRGQFSLFRIGDAWASRNIHAAIYDALRICKDL
ncbi:MAG: NADH:flavin oxidoreductase [Gammaproteobacteria bacterium]|nr:NADH:flavin oxidoreductase [Gammaproteobacteria bacterium]